MTRAWSLLLAFLLLLGCTRFGKDLPRKENGKSSAPVERRAG